MTDLFSVTLPIFLVILLGIGAVRAGVVTAGFVRDLGFFVLNFALPALVLNALIRQDLGQAFNWNYVAAYSGGSLVVFAGALFLFRIVLGRNQPYSAIASLGGVASNSSFVGFPAALLAVGAPAFTALPLSMLVEIVLIIPLAFAVAQAGAQDGRPIATVVREALVGLARMPLVIAILAGVLLSAVDIRLPAPVSIAVGMLADASAPLALFVVGGTLAALKASSLGGDLVWIVLAKLALHPLAVAAGFLLLGGVPPGLMAAGIILAAAPMMTIYPILGQRFGLGDLSAAALLVATAVSFATMTAAIAIVATGID